jgi:protein-S-isoprenylcysteine O-methyltransferase Ste14
VTGLYVWWSGMPRQKRTGWTLVVVAVGYLVYFLKARLFEAGPEITRKEWFYFIAMLVLIMLGTINIRMAEMRERNQKTMPLVDPSPRSRK